MVLTTGFPAAAVQGDPDLELHSRDLRPGMCRGLLHRIWAEELSVAETVETMAWDRCRWAVACEKLERAGGRMPTPWSRGGHLHPFLGMANVATSTRCLMAWAMSFGIPSRAGVMLGEIHTTGMDNNPSGRDHEVLALDPTRENCMGVTLIKAIQSLASRSRTDLLAEEASRTEATMEAEVQHLCKRGPRLRTGAAAGHLGEGHRQ